MQYVEIKRKKQSILNINSWGKIKHIKYMNIYLTKYFNIYLVFVVFFVVELMNKYIFVQFQILITFIWFENVKFATKICDSIYVLRCVHNDEGDAME